MERQQMTDDRVEYIRTPDDLRAALIKLGYTHEEFAASLRAIGQRASRQAVWKWLSGRNKTGIPGYVGLYLHSKHNLHSGNLS